jgi:hypothetical protein
MATLSLAVAACDASTSYGPMAVIEPEDAFPGALGGTGIVNITDRCVTLDLEGDTLLLAWHADHVTWLPETGEIDFHGPIGDPLVIGDGDTVTIGGASLVRDPGDDRPVNWVVEPDPSCEGQPWSVATVSR